MRPDLALAVLVAAACAAVAPSTYAAEPPGPVRASLALRVNGVDRGEALVVLDGGEVWMTPSDLEAAGLRHVAGRRAAIRGQEHVALGSLAPRLAFVLDERALRLELTAGPELLGGERLDLGRARPAGVIEATGPSAFANYSVQSSTDLHPGFAAEMGAGDGRWLLLSGVNAPPRGSPVRGLSSANLEEPERLRRWSAGDASVALGGLGSSGAVVGGLALARDFSLDPYYVQSARPATTAFAASPSTLEVYVNGALVRRQEVAPGSIDLANIPLAAGTNSVRTVLRDAYGREQTFDLRSFYSTGLLATGLTDYAYHLGFLREDFARDSFRYGRPVAIARHRLGLTDALTAGLRLEAGLDRASGGPGVAMGTILGEIDVEVAGSAERGESGASGVVSWVWNDRRANAGLRLRGTTARYATAVQDVAADRALLEASGYAGVRVAQRLGLGLEASGARWRDMGRAASLTARVDVWLGSRLGLLLSTTVSSQQGTLGYGGQAVLSWSPGASTVAQVGARAGSDGLGSSVSAQRSLPIGSGYGYRVEASTGAPQTRGAADVQWQTQYGRYEAQVEQTGQARTSSLTAAGGAVLIGGRGFLTRPVDASYGLMRVGVPDVRGYLENQEVGSTDGQGDLFVPALQPRYANRLKIRAADIPMDYEIGKVEQLVAPPLKRGAVAQFEVKPIRAVTARVEMEGGSQVPSGGALRMNDGAETLLAPLTADGRFFLERVSPGRHRAELSWADGACHLTLEVPDRAGILDLGGLRCAPEATAFAR